MATKTSVQNGNWSNINTWGGSIPADGDIVNVNHDITFDADQSSMTNGVSTITIATDKSLTIKIDSTTYLKWSTSINGPGTLQVGTALNPIQRPSEGVSTPRATLHYTGAATSSCFGSTLICNVHGYIPTTANHSFVDGNVSAGATQIPLIGTLDIQNGDQVVIGQGSIIGTLTETNKGFHTITDYDEETKTATITPALANDRYDGDVVAIYTRSIQFLSTNKPTVNSSTTTIMNEVEGVLFKKFIPYTWRGSIRYCTFESSSPTIYNDGSSLLEDSTICQIAGSSTSQIAKFAYGFKVKRCVIFNTNVILNYAQKIDIFESVFQNFNSSGIMSSSDINIFDSIFANATKLGNMTRTTKCYNCIFKNVPMLLILPLSDVSYHYPRMNIESFNHNGIDGAYASAQQTGSIVSEDDGTLHFNLIYNAEVYRDYPITVREGRICQYHITVLKDFTGGTVKAEIIDPAADPLIDGSASPLAIETMPDVADQKQSIKLSYKPNLSKQLTLRISATHNGGNIYFDPIVTFERFRRKELI